jgi:hypothetical protein
MDGESAQMPIMMGVLPGIVPTDYWGKNGNSWNRTIRVVWYKSIK